MQTNNGVFQSFDRRQSVSRNKLLLPPDTSGRKQMAVIDKQIVSDALPNVIVRNRRDFIMTERRKTILCKRTSHIHPAAHSQLDLIVVGSETKSFQIHTADCP